MWDVQLANCPSLRPPCTQVKNGSVFEGLFYAANLTAKDLDVVLLLARQVRDPSGTPVARTAPVHHRMKFLHSDIVQIQARAVDLDGRAEGHSEPGFGTDAEIGAKARACAPAAALMLAKSGLVPVLVE